MERFAKRDFIFVDHEQLHKHIKGNFLFWVLSGSQSFFFGLCAQPCSPLCLKWIQNDWPNATCKITPLSLRVQNVSC